MFQIVMKIMKWSAIPILLMAALFSYFAASYEPLLDFLVCMGAILFIQRSIWLKEYSWGAGMVAVVVVFSPLFLVTKVFLVMGLACIASFVALFAAFRTTPVAAL
jgi:hypothetical protein